MDRVKVSVQEQFSIDDKLTDTFKDDLCQAFSDTLKYKLIQTELPADKQNKKKLDRLSSLMLSRVLGKITAFNMAEDTKKFKTDYNWNCLIGTITAPKDETGILSTSHEAL